MLAPTQLNLTPPQPVEEKKDFFQENGIQPINPSDAIKPVNPQPVIPKTPEQIIQEQNQLLINQQIENDKKIAQQNQLNIEQQKQLDQKIKLDPRYTPIIVFSGGYLSA